MSWRDDRLHYVFMLIAILLWLGINMPKLFP